MRTWYLPLSFVLLLAFSIVTLACGSSSMRSLQSVTVNPSTASGNFQFVATGHYNRAPATVTPLPDATWGACLNGNPTSDITVSTNGLAQCGASASGSYTVWSYGTSATGAVCNVINSCGGGCGRVTGTATLTCP